MMFFPLLLSTFFPSMSGQSATRYVRSYGVGDNIQAMDMVVTNEGPLFAGYRRVIPGLAVLLQTNDSGHVLWSYQWGSAAASPLALTNIALLDTQTVMVSGFQSGSESAYIATFRLSDRTILASTAYSKFNAFYQELKTFTCKVSMAQDLYCAGTDSREETIVLMKLNANLSIQWRREFGQMFREVYFQAMTLHPAGTDLLVIGVSGIGGGNKYHVIIRVNTVDGTPINALKTNIDGIPKGADVTYHPDGQSFIVAFRTDQLGADAADTLLCEMRNDFSTIVWAGLLKQQGDNTVTQLKVDANNRIMLSSYMENHPINTNELAEFILIHPNRTLAWARYLSSSMHTRGMTVAFTNDGYAINIGGYAQNATGGKYSLLYGKLSLDGTIQTSPCLEVAIPPPVLSVLSLTGTFSNWLSSIPVNDPGSFSPTPYPLTPTALNLTVTTHCEQRIAAPISSAPSPTSIGGRVDITTQMVAGPTPTIGAATTLAPGIISTAFQVTAIGRSTNTTSPLNSVPVPPTSTSSTALILTAINTDSSTFSSQTTEQNSIPGNQTGLETMTMTPDNVLTADNGNFTPAASSPNQQDNLLLYIIIAVLGVLLSSVLSGVAIANLLKRKHLARQNSSPENPNMAIASGDDMQSARISQRYDDQGENVLQSKPSAAFSAMSAQYDSPPPPPQHATGTINTVSNLQNAAGPAPSAPAKTVNAKGGMARNNSDYQAVPQPRNPEAAGDYVELALRSPTVVLPLEQQGGVSQYTAAPRAAAKHATKATAAAATQNGIKRNVYDVVVQQGVVAQGSDDVPHASNESKNQLPKHLQYDNTDVPLEISTSNGSHANYDVVPSLTLSVKK